MVSRGRPTRRQREDVPLAALVATTGLGLALPLVGLPLATDPFMPLRTLVLGGSLSAGVLVPSRTQVSRRLVVGLVAAGAVFALAALVGRTPLLSLLGRYPRYEGLPMVVGYGLAVAVGAKLLSRPKTRASFVSALALAAAANAVVSLGQAVVDPGSRVTGLLSNSTTLGTFGLVALLVVGWQVVEGDRRTLVWVGTAGSAVCVVLSASRGVLVGAAVALVVGLVLSRRRTPSRSQR